MSHSLIGLDKPPAKPKPKHKPLDTSPHGLFLPHYSHAKKEPSGACYTCT